MFVLYTGLSRNEALALKWENISNDCSFINITEKCEFNEENEFDYRIIKVSKNEERTILITSKAKELLKEMRKQNNEGFIFVDNNRDNLKICSLINAFRNIQKKIRNKNFNITNITKYFTVYYLQEYLNDFELSYYEGDFVRTYLNNVKPDYFGFEKKMQMIDEALERNIEV